MRNRNNIFRLFLIGLLFLLALLGFGGAANAAVCVPTDAVPSTYKDVENPDYVPAIEEVSHTVTIVDEDAYDEQVLVTAETTIKHEAIPPTTTVYPPVFVPAVTHTVFHPAVTHVVHHEAVTHTVKHEEVSHTEYQYIQWITGKVKWRDTPTWNGQADNDWGWFYSGNSKTVVDQECWTEVVVDHVAYDETVVDTAAWTETVVDTAAYTIPGYEVLNEDGVDAWTEVVPAVYTTVHHDAVTHEETVVDIEAEDAIGNPTISVVDVPGTPAVVCEPEPTETPTVVVVIADPAPPAPPAAATVVVAQDELDWDDSLAHTGSTSDRLMPWAIGFVMIGIIFGTTAYFGRRYDKQHPQSL